MRVVFYGFHVACVACCCLTPPAAYVTSAEIQHGTVYSRDQAHHKNDERETHLRACSESVLLSMEYMSTVAGLLELGL